MFEVQAGVIRYEKVPGFVRGQREFRHPVVAAEMGWAIRFVVDNDDAQGFRFQTSAVFGRPRLEQQHVVHEQLGSFRCLEAQLVRERAALPDLEIECRVRPIPAFSTRYGVLPFLAGLAVRENDLEVAGAREAIAEAQTVKFAQRPLAAQADANPRLTGLRVYDGLRCLPRQRRLVFHDFEVAGPLIARALFASVEPASEKNAVGERLRLRFWRGIVQDDVVDDQLSVRRDVELDVVNALVFGERPAAAIWAARLRHVHRRGLPRTLRQIRERQEAMIALRQAVNLHPQRVGPLHPITETQPRGGAHRRAGHGIENDSFEGLRRVAHLVVEVLRFRRAIGAAVRDGFGKTGRNIVRLRHAAKPPALLDVRFVIFEDVNTPGQITALDHPGQIAKLLFGAAREGDYCEKKRQARRES
jgi:hypothetical protein